jgi:hypothetical protein
VCGICAGEGVDDVDVAGIETTDELAAEAVEVILVDRLVDSPPPDPLFRLGLADDELVLRRAARELARVDDERSPFGETPLTAEQCVRVEQRRRRLPVDAALRAEPVLAERSLGRDRDRQLLPPESYVPSTDRR